MQQALNDQQLMNGRHCNDCGQEDSLIFVSDEESIYFNILISAAEANDPQSYKMYQW